MSSDTVDAVYRSKRVMIEDKIEPASLFVKDGKITKIDTYEAGEQHTDVLQDFGDLVIMSGVVDAHVHINEPGNTDWEGFHSATRAACSGGVTTLVDMPLNSIPVTTTVAALDRKIASTRTKLWCDVGFWGGITPDNIEDIIPLAREGVCGYKSFMTHSGLDEFEMVTEKEIRLAMEQFVRMRTEFGLDLVYLFHAEVPGPIEEATKECAGKDQTKYETFLSTRPKQAENEAISLVIDLCKEYDVRCHIVHLSSADGIEMIRKAQEDNVKITAETTLHYLFFQSETIPERATMFKCCPPIRDSANRDLLWDGLKQNVINCIVSDHSPCTVDLKCLEDGDFMKAWGGISSLSLNLPIVWTQAKQRKLTLFDVQRWLCSRPAQLAGLTNTKGSIKVNNDADFVVWSPESEFVVDQTGMRVNNILTPYHGQHLFGVVHATILRGVVIFRDGKIVAGEAPGICLKAN